MMTYSENKQIKFHMVTIENLVPENHFLRKLDRLVDFSFIREQTQAYYCHNNGRPCIDPVVLVKYLLIGFLYSIESERRLEQEIQVNMAYRWFLGLDLDERIIPRYRKTGADDSTEKVYIGPCFCRLSANAWKRGWWMGS